MKNNFFSIAVGVVTFVLLTAVFSFASDNMTTVGGYQVAEYAVKSVVKEHLDSIVDQLAGKQVIITVAGSADVVGNSSQNDELAAKRAEHARAYLAGKLSLADVKAWSEGNSANARQVTVSWKDVPATAAVATKTQEESNLRIYLIMGMVLILLAVGSLLWANKKKVVTTVTQSNEYWANVTVGKEIYFVRLVYKNGKWFSPFKVASGTQIFHQDKGWIINNSLKDCLRKDAFAEQKAKLLVSGDIKIKK